ncbi:shikimate kinase [Aquimarina sp. U1-2]|uniref:shikimate kinase n=1 Tax=Aquimarina sp. U1-2 TaxID=2823141 RepID=UPI001AED06B7|nr:shikimate kinase [Aquimarina sp. U1-2]MBP2832316.1 shikimate kinase [Aquimarina sp. U1-2]
MNIVLMGYMGSGKSLLGKELAKHLKREYLDLDQFIESKEEKLIKEIFELKGEVYFRKKETQYLKEVLSTDKNAVISLGGGTPCFSGNLEIIKQNSTSVYLQTSLDELTQRLYHERNKRPLLSHLSNRDALQDFIRKHLFERSFYYNQADHKIVTDNKDKSQIVTEITALLL